MRFLKKQSIYFEFLILPDTRGSDAGCHHRSAIIALQH